MPQRNPIRRTVLTGLIVLLWTSAILPAAVAQEATGIPLPAVTAIPRPQPTTSLTSADGFTVELYFGTLPQGRAALLHVYGEGITEAKVRFLNKLTGCFPALNDGYFCLISTNMEQNPRQYELSVFTSFADGRRGSLTTQVEVVSGGFIRQDFAIASDLAYLIDPQVERDEFARLDGIDNTFTPEILWDANGFSAPIVSELASPFGAYRTLNDTVQTRHTGWDLRAVLGTPIGAMASGRVAFAGALDIRGNYVMIDHGYGLYSGYAHLSQIHVTRGQTVTKGQIIGVSGESGRGNGPHLHWEVVVNGEWVDSVDFIQMWMPLPG
jgi:hypothetical protein